MPASKEIAIIGAGPAGVAAAVQCARLGIHPWLADRSGSAGGLVENAFSVENYPGLEPMDGPSFALLLRAHLDRFGVSVDRACVRRVTPASNGFLIEGDFGRISARSVIAAFGTEARALDIPGALELSGSGLYYELVNPPLDLPFDEVIVIGGGEAALDYSLSLAKLGVKVSILVRGDSLRAAGRLVDVVESSDSMEIVFNARPRSMRRTSGGIEVELTVPGGAIVRTAGAVVAAIGRTSRTADLINGLDAHALGTVSTRIPGLFIAGGARTGTLGQAGMAVGDGLCAAMKAVSYIRALGGLK
jgi:thioredoxin reductase (NADPH)